MSEPRDVYGPPTPEQAAAACDAKYRAALEAQADRDIEVIFADDEEEVSRLCGALVLCVTFFAFLAGMFTGNGWLFAAGLAAHIVGLCAWRQQAAEWDAYLAWSREPLVG